MIYREQVKREKKRGSAGPGGKVQGGGVIRASKDKTVSMVGRRREERGKKESVRGLRGFRHWAYSSLLGTQANSCQTQVEFPWTGVKSTGNLGVKATSGQASPWSSGHHLGKGQKVLFLGLEKLWIPQLT